MDYPKRDCKKEERDHRFDPVPGHPEKLDGVHQVDHLAEITKELPEYKPENNRGNRRDDHDIHQLDEPFMLVEFLSHYQCEYKDYKTVPDIPDHDTEKDGKEDSKNGTGVDLMVSWRTDKAHEEFKRFHEPRVVVIRRGFLKIPAGHLKLADDHLSPELPFE